MASLILVDIQIDDDATLETDEGEEPPTAPQLQNWVEMAYGECGSTPAELTLRLVGKHEMTGLNEQFRGKQGATNVLSFPFETPEYLSEEMTARLLGDIVICHPVVVAEAKQQEKNLAAHYAHMVTHGVLHLCGYDHQREADAKIMESLECQILAQQGINDPYQASQH